MSLIFLNNNPFKKEIAFFFFLYITLLISFFLGENSTGGAISDYINQKKASQEFASDFFKTFYEYDTFRTRHSPVLIIFLSLFERINLPDFLIRLIHLHICLVLPLLLYKCLNVKFYEIDKRIFLFYQALFFITNI